MEIEKILEKFPHSFLNLNTTDINIIEHENEVELQIEQKNDDFISEINIPTHAQDIKITKYQSETLVEFYYKKTNYFLRF